MSGFAEGVRAGMALGSAVRQAYRDNKRDEEIDQINNAKVDDVQAQGPTPDGGALTGTMFAFLGKNFQDRPSEDQLSEARTAAKAGVLEKYGDVQGADRMRSNARADKLAALQIKQATRQGDREDRADADEAKMRAVDEDTAKWFQARLTNADGTARDATPDDHLEAGQYRVAKLIGAGQIKAANGLAKDNMTMAAQKIQLQTAERNDALARVGAQVAAGDLSGLGDFYQRYIPDGAKVKNITQDAKGQIKVERESVDGRTLAPTTFKNRDELLAGLKTFQDPMALYNYSMNEFTRGLQERQVKVSERQASNQERRLDQAETEKREASIAAVDYYKQQNPNATPAEIEAVRTGVLSTTPKDDHRPSEVKLADALVKAGLAPDMKSALEMSLTKKAMSPQERFFELSKPQGGIAPDPSSVGKVMEQVYGSDWQSKIKASKPAAADGAPKKGDKRTIQSGPNAGKTAEFDGTGWVLSP